MSGTITDMALRICACCRRPWIEDDRMYLDPNRCPHCGAMPGDCPFLFGRAAAAVVPATAWELNEGDGHYESNEGGGYYESNE